MHAQKPSWGRATSSPSATSRGKDALVEHEEAAVYPPGQRWLLLNFPDGAVLIEADVAEL